MRWSRDHDVLLMREILLHEPWANRHGSPERGKAWEEVSDSLNGAADAALKFKVTQRSVRDRFKLLMQNYKKRQNEEIKASGIAPPEETELEHALEDIIERFQEADTNYRKELEDKKTKNEVDTRKAVEMRKRSLETFSESMDRSEDSKKRPRSTGNETLQYLRERSEQEMKIKEDELKLKKIELQQQKGQALALQQQQESIMQYMLSQQQQQFNAQQQQQTALLALFSKVADKLEK